MEAAAYMELLVVGDTQLLKRRDGNPQHPLQKRGGRRFCGRVFLLPHRHPAHLGTPSIQAEADPSIPSALKRSGGRRWRKRKFNSKGPNSSLPTTIYSWDGTWRTGPTR